jgi:hypothetical protein
MPMQRDIMKAQADTMTTWGEEWRRLAGEGVEGAAEVGFQLGRLAKLARSIADGVSAPAETADETALPPVETGALRVG